MIQNGLFITFEGSEGAGKSTQIGLLAERLKGYGREIVVTREPGGTPLGEEIRELLKHNTKGEGMSPETELLLMNASRAQLVRELINPALKRGAIVLSDRFFDSTIAYQGFGRNVDLQALQKITEFAIGETQPNLTLLLRLPLALSEERRRSRGTGEDRFEKSAREFFERVEKGFDFVESTGGDRVRAVDARNPVEKVSEEIWKWVKPLVEKSAVEGEKAFKTIGEYRQRSP